MVIIDCRVWTFLFCFKDIYLIKMAVSVYQHDLHMHCNKPSKVSLQI